MGGALAKGLLKSGMLSAADITVADPSQTALDRFALSGASITTNNSLAVQNADFVIVVVKPWLVEQVIADIKDAMDYSRQTLIVVAAGVSSGSILAWADKQGERPQLLLAIPNIAIAELSSMTFIVPATSTDSTTRTVKMIFDAMGTTLITEESHLAAGTTLASCGIAYAMRYIRAASEGGVEIGFKADDAKAIVLQTVKGAVDLLVAGGNHPEAEIDKVTTPGGVTIKGLNEMEHAGFTSAVIRGLKAGMK